MPLWLQMSRNYSNPESVNYKLAYLREQMEQQLLNLGDLAYADKVQLAMLGDTIQIGGYIRTELIDTRMLQIGDEDTNVFATKDGITVNKGNIVVKDAHNTAIITSQGLKAVYVYGSNGAWGGWDKMGLDDYGLQSYNSSVIVYVPDNFTITKATLITKVMPCYRTNDPRGAPDGYYFPRQLRLYTADLSSGVIWVDGYTIYETPEYQTRHDLTTSIWGGEWTPTGTTMRTKTADISSVLTAGHNVLLVRTGMANTEYNRRYFGLVRMDVAVEGFLRG